MSDTVHSTKFNTEFGDGIIFDFPTLRKSVAFKTLRISAKFSRNRGLSILVSRWEHLFNKIDIAARASTGVSPHIDCGTFRTPLLMSKRTIRIPDEGGWSGVGWELRLWHSNTVAVEHQLMAKILSLGLRLKL